MRVYAGMAREGITEELARSMLAKQGVSMIWKLHEDAATLHRAGNVSPRRAF